MVLIQIALTIVGIAVTIVLLRKLNRAKAAEDASRPLLLDTPNQNHWNAFSVGLKMAACAAMAAAVVGASILWVSAGDAKARSTTTTTALVAWLLASAMTGALIGYCLALRERLLELRSSGQRVNPVLRRIFVRATCR